MWTRINSVSGCLLLALTACAPVGPPPPVSDRGDHVDTLHGVEIADPYRWLEDQADPATRAWIEEQNAYSETVIGEGEVRGQLRARFRELIDVDTFGPSMVGGDFEYFTLRRRGDELPVIYRRPKPDGEDLVKIAPADEHERVLDPHTLSADHSQRVELAAVHPDGNRVLYNVRIGGQDEVEVRLRDVAAGVDLPEVLPWGLYSSVAFTRDGSGFVYSHRSRSTGPRAWFHELGTSPDADRLLFGDGYGPRSFLSVSEVDDEGGLLYTAQHGWSSTELHFGNLAGGDVTPILVGLAGRSYGRFVEEELWVHTSVGAPNNRLVVVDAGAPEVGNWKEVLAESEHVLDDYTVIGERLYATYLVDLSERIRVFELDGTFVSEIPLPDQHSVSIAAAGPGKALLTLQSFLQPEESYLLDLESGERELWRASEVPFDSAGLTLERQNFRSKDGVEVPIFVVRSASSGDQAGPALLTGYGGFNAALTPRFNARAAVWVEQGGVFAQANLRGGSEYGERWHRDGMLENKQHVFDDFIAASEWLIDRGLTEPAQLAIQGASNGGLLVASAFTQRPDLYRAVLCGFPDLDMVRFNQFSDTNNIPALLEYGDAGIPEQFEFLRAYSPYQAVTAGTDYPAVMLTSGDNDTRVPPLQARKMAATLQHATASDLPVVLRYSEIAGHAAGRGVSISQSVEDRAAEFAFLLTQVGTTGTN